jgi:ribosome-associated protein
VIAIPLAAGVIEIPEEDLTFTASRSGGPGGQNVNKVSSRVTLEFDVRQSPSLTDEQRQRILRKLSTRINKDGVLRIISQRTRSQELNRVDARERLVELIQAALRIDRARIQTRVPRAAKEHRVETKRKRGETKRLRRTDTENE